MSKLKESESVDVYELFQKGPNGALRMIGTFWFNGDQIEMLSGELPGNSQILVEINLAAAEK